MTKVKRIYKANILALLLIGIMAVGVYGDEPIADVDFGASEIIWRPLVGFSQLELTISRPDGTIYHKSYEPGGTPYAGLEEIYGKGRYDGSYIYELRMVQDVKPMKRESDDVEIRYSRAPLTQTGGFSVVRGEIIPPDQGEPDAQKSESSSMGSLAGTKDGLSGTMDFVINDDLIVDGSACIGFDCVNGESFGFDTLRLKENNLRIKFDDTSTAASFPRNDWQLTANDSANGGASKFSIDDITNARTPFTVEANARSHSLYVDDGGRIGIRTSTPSMEIHVIDGDTPGLRLQQDGSSGFAPQTWDIAGNETNFFIRDVTNGSTLPFRIRPGAPSSSIMIASDGSVGFRTASPGFPVHLLTDSSTDAAIVAQRSGGTTVFMNATSTRGTFGTTTDHNLRFVRNSLFQMDLVGNSDIVMADGGGYNGTWNPASSRALKENITDLTLDEAVTALEGLNPVKYNYKADKEEPRVGFIAEDVPDLVAMNGRKTLGTVDIMAVLTKVLKDQQKTIEELKEEIAVLKKQVAEK